MKTSGSRGGTSSSVTPSREAALQILLSVDRGRRLDRAFEFESRSLTTTDRRWVQELTFGATRHRGRVDAVLDARLHDGPDSVSPGLRALLRLGAYQLLWMHGVPAHAAVSQSVEMARKHFGAGAARLTNALLRAIGPDDLATLEFLTKSDGTEDYLSRWGSHPRWLIERWLERWGSSEVEKLVEANNRIPGTHLRTLSGSVGEALDRLERCGISASPHDEVPGLISLGAGQDVARALKEVGGFVQDPAAAWVTEYAAVEPEWRVADLCAAPGGKALALSRTARHVLALDRSPARLVLLRENVRRTGARVSVVRGLAEAAPVRGAELVLVDAPCSGTGTFARHPDAKWRIDLETVETLAGVQSRMLDAAARAVPAGGVLVYSTCTLEEEENEAQANAFLDRHAEFRVDPVVTSADRFVDADGFLRVLPHRSGSDGAFAARFRRVS